MSKLTKKETLILRIVLNELKKSELREIIGIKIENKKLFLKLKR